MVLLLTLLFPFGLMLLILAMERVERPLRVEAVGERVVAVLPTARVEEVESLVQHDAAKALESYWRRRAWIARLRSRRRAVGG